jgi:hypothetical protein
MLFFLIISLRRNKLMKKNVVIAGDSTHRILAMHPGRNTAVKPSNAERPAKKPVRSDGYQSLKTGIISAAPKTAPGSGLGERITRITDPGNRQKRPLCYKMS